MAGIRADMIEQAAEWIRSAQRVVALTGAGISVDSGVPDFRSPGGLWERFDPMEYATIDAFRHTPEKVWEMIRSLESILDAAHPNPGHVALMRLERCGKLNAIITQNIDNLHQDAGSRNVIEFHGNGRQLVCLSCGATYLATDDFGEFPPRCVQCVNEPILKPEVVFFGEMIPPLSLAAAQRETQAADVMIVAGTSAYIAPASLLPTLAKEHGAKVIEVNLEETPLTGTIADLSIRGGTSQVLPAIVDRICR